VNLMMRLVAAASTVVLWPIAAHAADELELSNDGATWASSLPAPLFDSNFHWVPGDRQERSFWVRNRSHDGAVLDIAVLGTTVDSLLDTGDLDVEVRAGNGAWHSTDQAGRHELVSSMPVAAGQREKVTVAVDLDAASVNQSQVKKLALSFEVRLTQDVTGRGGRHDGDDGSGHRGDHDRDGDLPGTGGQPWWVLPLGAALTGGGMLVVGAMREERADE
jgi:hypothetical protein